MAFPTPYQMFEEYMDKEARIQFSLERLMQEYAEKAERRIGEYVECIAESYLCGYERATKIFKDSGLNILHALAVLDDVDGFDEEYREKEMKYWEPDEDD